MVSKVNLLQNTGSSCRVLSVVASMDVVSMAVCAILKQRLSLFVHSRTIQQTLQLIRLTAAVEERVCVRSVRQHLESECGFGYKNLTFSSSLEFPADSALQWAPAALLDEPRVLVHRHSDRES